MKHLLFLTFILSSFITIARPLTISNDSDFPIEVILWKDSKVIFHHVMNPNDEITIEDIGNGLLLQFRVKDVVFTDHKFHSCDHAKLIDHTWVEIELSRSHFKQHEWLRPITKFGIELNINKIEPRA